MKNLLENFTKREQSMRYLLFEIVYKQNFGEVIEPMRWSDNKKDALKLLELYKRDHIDTVDDYYYAISERKLEQNNKLDILKEMLKTVEEQGGHSSTELIIVQSFDYHYCDNDEHLDGLDIIKHQKDKTVIGEICRACINDYVEEYLFAPYSFIKTSDLED